MELEGPLNLINQTFFPRIVKIVFCRSSNQEAAGPLATIGLFNDVV